MLRRQQGLIKEEVELDVLVESGAQPGSEDTLVRWSLPIAARLACTDHRENHANCARWCTSNSESLTELFHRGVALAGV